MAIPGQPRRHRGVREIEGISYIPDGAMQGVCKAGHCSAEAHGQRRVLEVQNDFIAGHHRRVEGKSNLQRRNLWASKRGKDIRFIQRNQKRKIKISSETVKDAIYEPTYKKGVQSCHNERGTQESSQAHKSRPHWSPTMLKMPRSN